MGCKKKERREIIPVNRNVQKRLSTVEANVAPTAATAAAATGQVMVSNTGSLRWTDLLPPTPVQHQLS